MFLGLVHLINQAEILIRSLINVGPHMELYFELNIFGLEGRGGRKKRSKFIENKPRLWRNIFCFFLVWNILSVHTALNHLWAVCDSTLATWGKSRRQDSPVAASSLWDFPTVFPECIQCSDGETRLAK